MTARSASRAVLCAVVATVTAGPAEAATTHHLRSPNGRIEVVVQAGERLTYDVTFDEKVLLRAAALSMDIDHVVLGAHPEVKETRSRSVDRRVEPVVRQRAAALDERFNELRLDFAGGFAVVFRAYDQGVAYRFETALTGRTVKIYGEQADFKFAVDGHVYFPHEDSFSSHNEREFHREPLAAIAPDALGSIPAVFEPQAGAGDEARDESGGLKVFIAESDLDDYPGMWLRGGVPGAGSFGLRATFPPNPREQTLDGDRDYKIVKAADTIAVTRGSRTFPWRILGIAERDRDLMTNTLVYLLARPTELRDTSWIRPGKVAWDWWNALNLRGVGFKPGVNTQTYEYYLDFAAKYGLEYVILDEGWYQKGNLLQVAPELDMPRLLAHAREKHVGIILWVIWKTLDDQFQAALDQFERWGVKGLKVDFIQRDDQEMVNFYHRACRELAKRKMVLLFHGGLRPVLLTRTWPNLLTAEGVKGLEHVKWSRATTPEHDLTLPFTRMILGPMDYTPGAMLNADRSSFEVNFKRPMSMGTRVHQLAMYVVFESPLQMLADSPTNYLAEPDAMEFLGPVPSVWDETRVLDAKLGDFVVVARRRGKDWWVGAMTDWTPRELTIELGFLGEGKGTMTVFADGPKAARTARDYRKTTVTVDRATRVTAKLAPGGGWAAHIVLP